MKLKLIEFYKENKILWNNDDPNRNNKIKKNTVKEKMFKSFNGKFAILSLEKTFHSLQLSFTREFKKIKVGIEPKKKWTFCDAMLFLSSKTTNKKVEVDLEEKENLFPSMLIIQPYGITRIETIEIVITEKPFIKSY